MRFHRASRLTVLGATAACCASGLLAEPPQFAARILAGHNGERAQVGSAPLVWDPALAAGAAQWAQYLAATGQFDHSDRRARRGIGENLWAGTRGAYTVEFVTRMWGNEKRNFVPGIFPNVSRTGNWLDIVHYSQMIWPATQRVGCAMASGRGRDYLVCRYAPTGNIDGRRVPALPVPRQATATRG